MKRDARLLRPKRVAIGPTVKKVDQSSPRARTPINTWRAIAFSGYVLYQVIASVILLPLVVEAFQVSGFPNNLPNSLILLGGIVGSYVFQFAIWLWFFRWLNK